MPVTSTQQFVSIAQIKQSVLILKNGGLRAILKITPVNFALKSQQDQEILVGQFQNFINSLEFPLQMAVQSRRLDVFPYLKNLSDYAQNIPSQLLKIHAFDYINFVQKLTDLANIMEKKFFCIVPYEARPIENPGMFKKFFSARAKISITQSQFNRYKQELDQRTQTISSGLESMGLSAKRLNTQEIIEEFYYVFNPEEASEERLQSLGKISTPIISAQPKTTAALPRSDQQIKVRELQKPINNAAHKLNPPASPKTKNPPPQIQKQSAPASPKTTPQPNPPQKPASKPQPAPKTQSTSPKKIPVINSQIQQDAQNILDNLNKKI